MSYQREQEEANYSTFAGFYSIRGIIQIQIFLEEGLRISYISITEMLVFRKNKWCSVNIPRYIDPAWGFGDRQKVASVMIREIERGVSETEAFKIAEASIYESLGNNIAPQSTKKKRAV